MSQTSEACSTRKIDKTSVLRGPKASVQASVHQSQSEIILAISTENQLCVEGILFFCDSKQKGYPDAGES